MYRVVQGAGVVRNTNIELKMLLSLGLDYFRWTQLTPMLFTWGFALLMLLMLVFVNFQQQVVNVLEYFAQWLMQLPLVGVHVTELLSGQEQTVNVGIDGLKSFAFKAWLALSLLFTLMAMALSAWLGPFKVISLKRKLIFAASACMLLLGGFILNYFAVPENFNGAMAGWMFQFSLIALLVFVVSAYSLSVSHALGRLNAILMKEPAGASS